MGERPTAAFVLSLLAGILYLIAGIAVAAIASIALLIPFAGGFIFAVGLIGLVSGILMIYGASKMNSEDKGQVRLNFSPRFPSGRRHFHLGRNRDWIHTGPDRLDPGPDVEPGATASGTSSGDGTSPSFSRYEILP